MSYQEQNDLYRDLNQRGRMEMCVREQGVLFSVDPFPANVALGQGVTAGNLTDIDAVIAAVSVHQNWEQIPEDDVALLGAVQGVWSTVAVARYPQAA